MQKNTEHTAVVSAGKGSIIRQVKAEQKTVPIEIEQTAKRPMYPKPSVLASKYPGLKEIGGQAEKTEQGNFRM